MRAKALEKKLKIVRGRCSCLAAKLPGRLATLLLVSIAGNPQPLFAQQPFPEIPVRTVDVSPPYHANFSAKAHNWRLTGSPVVAISNLPLVVPRPRSRFSHSTKATSPGGQAIARKWFFLAYAIDPESELFKSLKDWFDRDVGKSTAPPTVPMTIDLPSN